MFKTKSITSLAKRSFFTIVPAYKKGVRLFLGKFQSEISAGINLNLPFFHRIITIDTTEQIKKIPEMEVISANGVTYKVDGSIHFAVDNAKNAILNVNDIYNDLIEKCKMTMRTELGKMDIATVLSSRTSFSDTLVKELKDTSERWGVDLKSIQISNIVYDESIKKAMSAEAEATNISEGKKIHARADLATAEIYKQSAQIYKENPITLRLREYQLLTQIAQNPASTIILFPSEVSNFIKELKQ